MIVRASGMNAGKEIRLYAYTTFRTISNTSEINDKIRLNEKWREFSLAIGSINRYILNFVCCLRRIPSQHQTMVDVRST